LRRFLGRALKTHQPSLSMPCFAERRYGGVLDDEMLMALPARRDPQGDRRDGGALQERLALPLPANGIQQDVRDGMAVSYPGRGG
jgi:hypothetical protein